MRGVGLLVSSFWFLVFPLSIVATFIYNAFMFSSFSFGVFADPHYADRVYMDRQCRASAVKLRACLQKFNERGLSLAICLGDLIDSAADRAGEIGNICTMMGVFATFSGERHLVLGNHDLARFTKAEFLQAAGVNPPASYYSFEAGGVHFVVLDGNCHEDGPDFARGDFAWDHAWVSPVQLQWLAHDLALHQRDPAIVLIHENLERRQGDGALDAHSVRNADAVRQVLECAGNVRAVIQGHYHPGAFTRINGISYITLSAMVTGDSNAFGIVTITADGVVSLEGFGAQESYRV